MFNHIFYIIHKEFKSGVFLKTPDSINFLLPYKW